MPKDVDMWRRVIMHLHHEAETRLVATKTSGPASQAR
jgi:hypothetical protein